MKCKNCGGNYRSTELICPYCGTENLLGRMWAAQKSEAEKEYEQVQMATGKAFSPYVMNRILNRMLVITIGIVLLSIVIVIAAAFVRSAKTAYNQKHHGAEMKAQLEQYYADGEFGQMYQYLSENELFGVEDYYAYNQIALLYYNYDRYLTEKMTFLGMTPEKQQEDTFNFEYSIRDSQDVYTLDEGIYSELDSRNEAQYKEWCQEILAYWKGTLGMTDDEVALLAEDDWSKSVEIDALIGTVREREAWTDAEE